MSRDEYILNLKKIFEADSKSFKFFLEQIDNYYKCMEKTSWDGAKYKVGDDVLLKQNQLMRGEGALIDLDDERLKFISENGFISPDFTVKYNKEQKTPLCVPVWIIQKDMMLKDYIVNYSGATLRYVYRDGKKKTKLVPYGKIDEEIDSIRDEDFWTWNCEQTKEIRFMPSLAKDKIQISFIMNVDNEWGKRLVFNDIFNLKFDKDVLKSFVSEWFINDFIYALRDDFTTNREGAVIFGIPSCYIEGVLVGRVYEKDMNMLDKIKKYFPNCYICNLDGKVIVE